MNMVIHRFNTFITIINLLGLNFFSLYFFPLIFPFYFFPYNFLGSKLGLSIFAPFDLFFDSTTIYGYSHRKGLNLVRDDKWCH